MLYTPKYHPMGPFKVINYTESQITMLKLWDDGYTKEVCYCIYIYAIAVTSGVHQFKHAILVHLNKGYDQLCSAMLFYTMLCCATMPHYALLCYIMLC